MTYEEARNARRALRASQPVVEAPVADNSDLSLWHQLKAAIEAGIVASRDLPFATSLSDGFKKYGSFTDRQRPHVERLIAGPKAPVESPDKALADALRVALPNLRPSDQSFAASLLGGFDRFGSFTDRQRPYAEKLARSVPGLPAAEAPLKAQVQTCPNIVSKVNLNGFSRFTVGLLALSLKNDGSVIWIKYDGRIVGSIDSATAEVRTTRRYASQYAIDKALIELALIEADPLAAARENGVRTGRCSCCGRPLTDPVSIGFGIGPVCRERGFGINL